MSVINKKYNQAALLRTIKSIIKIDNKVKLHKEQLWLGPKHTYIIGNYKTGFITIVIYNHVGLTSYITDRKNYTYFGESMYKIVEYLTNSKDIKIKKLKTF